METLIKNHIKELRNSKNPMKKRRQRRNLKKKQGKNEELGS
jgi:hypothetical protein